MLADLHGILSLILEDKRQTLALICIAKVVAI